MPCAHRSGYPVDLSLEVFWVRQSQNNACVRVAFA